MGFAEAAHLPPPRRIAGKRQHAAVARLAGHEQRMLLRIVRLGQHLRVRLQFAALDPIRAIERRQLRPRFRVRVQYCICFHLNPDPEP